MAEPTSARALLDARPIRSHRRRPRERDRRRSFYGGHCAREARRGRHDPPRYRLAWGPRRLARPLVRRRRAGRRRTGRQANRPPLAERLRASRLDGHVLDLCGESLPTRDSSQIPSCVADRSQAQKTALAAAERGRRSARMVLDLEAGELEIATVGTVALGMLPRVLRRWGPRHRGCTVRLHEHRDAPMLARAVAEGSADLGIGPRPPEWTGPFEPLGWEEFVVILPPGDPLRADEERVALAALAEREWVLFEREHALAELTDRLCAAEGFTPRAAVRSVQIAGVAALAAAGLGPALVPSKIVVGPSAPRSAASTRPALALRLRIQVTFITPLSTAARSSSGDDPLEPWKTYWKRAPACVRAQVLLERQRRAIEHVRVERSASAAGACTSSRRARFGCV
jgi:DNA-binding transcriptional LysR family regulator